MSIPDVHWLFFGHQGFGIVQANKWHQFLTSSAILRAVSYWHYSLTSHVGSGDVRDLVQDMSISDIDFWFPGMSCGHQNLGQIYVISWHLFLNSSGHAEILVIWSDIWPILTSRWLIENGCIFSSNDAQCWGTCTYQLFSSIHIIFIHSPIFSNFTHNNQSQAFAFRTQAWQYHGACNLPGLC